MLKRGGSVNELNLGFGNKLEAGTSLDDKIKGYKQAHSRFNSPRVCKDKGEKHLTSSE